MLILLLHLALAQADCVAADAVRVQHHLFTVETELRAHPPKQLSAAQSAARQRNLDHLHAYAARGVFPRNPLFAAPTPFFIDAEGTRCAMAALIEAEGGADFVQRVARERNNATVHALADEPALIAWLRDNGMTVDEAALVQPSYSSCRSRADALCAGDTLALFRVSRLDAGDLYGAVEQVWGGDGGMAVGSEWLLNRNPAPPFEAGLIPGVPVLGFMSDGNGPGALHRLTADGGVWSLSDRRCADRPTVPLGELVRARALGWTDCQGALGQVEPRCLRTLCTSNSERVDYCLSDGGEDPSLAPGHVAPKLDAGSSGADAGTAGPVGPRGLGCSTSQGSAMSVLMLVLLASRQLRRSRP